MVNEGYDFAIDVSDDEDSPRAADRLQRIQRRIFNWADATAQIPAPSLANPWLPSTRPSSPLHGQDVLAQNLPPPSSQSPGHPTIRSQIIDSVLPNGLAPPWLEIHRGFVPFVLSMPESSPAAALELLRLSKEWAEWDMLNALANYQPVVKILLQHLTVKDVSNATSVAMGASEQLSHDALSVSDQMTTMLCDSVARERLFSCRGHLAQQLLDLLQDLLDSPHELRSRPLLSKALLKLSGKCGLLPTCFALKDLEKLGQQVAGGGYGDIWRGRIGGQIVAVKSMRQFQDDDISVSLKKLGREALIWRQLSHPNLLPFLGLYTLEGRPSLVSPWMDNGDLNSFLRNPPVGTNRLSLILDIAIGLQYLHSENIVHGDLKTANVLVTPSRRACIADFGLSSIVDVLSLNTTLSTRGGRPGTVRYQAPELLSDQRPNHFGSDVYAFACLCYEVSTGKVPFFETRNEGAIILKVMQGVRPSRLETISPAPLWPLLESCWAENPEDRPTMISTVQLLQSEPIAAPVKESRPDWDETYSARFRRSVQEWPLVPSVPEIERRITRYNARQPTTSHGDLGPDLLPRPPAPFKDAPAEVFSGEPPLSTPAINTRPPAPSTSHTVPLPSWLPPGVWPHDPTKLYIHPYLSWEAPSYIHPYLSWEAPSSTVRLDLAPSTVHWRVEAFTAPGFHPPLMSLQIVHPRIPYWPVQLTSPGELTARVLMPISVYDVLISLHHAMHEPITHADWESLNPEDAQAVTKAFTHRCRMEAAQIGVLASLRDREVQERNKGVKRVDFLLGKTVFKGLFKAPEDPDGCLQMVTASLRSGGTYT